MPYLYDQGLLTSWQAHQTAAEQQHSQVLIWCDCEQVFKQVSTVIGAAVKEQRDEAAWTEGVAIWVAVLVVSLVGELFLLSGYSLAIFEVVYNGLDSN